MLQCADVLDLGPITSPLEKFGGLAVRAKPTPTGVPVAMIAPGLEKALEIMAMIETYGKTPLLVF